MWFLKENAKEHEVGISEIRKKFWKFLRRMSQAQFYHLKPKNSTIKNILGQILILGDLKKSKKKIPKNSHIFVTFDHLIPSVPWSKIEYLENKYLKSKQ